MVKTTFNIRTDNFDNKAARLFIEIAPQQVTCFVHDNDNNFINFLAFTLSKSISDSIAEIKEIISDPLFGYSFQKVCIMWVQSQSILIPVHLNRSNNNLEILSLVFGPENECVYKTDFLKEFDLYNSYRIPSALYDLIEKKFPDAQHYHQFSMLPVINDKKESTLLCIFYNNGFAVQLKNNGKIIFNNYFSFMVPEDVAYYLLNICTTFGLPVQNIQLLVAGLIEKESILFKELYKYFLNIHFFTFLQTHTRNEALKNYPNHFFDHLFLIATCV